MKEKLTREIAYHDIRIGEGLNNSFLYLFHLRYQLRLDQTRRDNEKHRLCELFLNAIQYNKGINPNDLMKVPAN